MCKISIRKAAFCQGWVGNRSVMAASKDLSMLTRVTFGLDNLHLDSEARSKGPRGSSRSRCHGSRATRSKGDFSFLSGSQSHEMGTESHATQRNQSRTVQSLDRHAYDEKAQDYHSAAMNSQSASGRHTSGFSIQQADLLAKHRRLTNIAASADHSPTTAKSVRLSSPIPIDSIQSLHCPPDDVKASVATETPISPATSSDKHRLPPRFVPKPSAGYLAHARTKPCSVNAPQHLLLVIDLNGTLLFRTHPNKSFHPRPWLPQFFDYCFANHSILIWSSARPHNVMRICERLFSADQRALLLGEWSRDKLNLTKAQYNQRLQVYKTLDSIWHDEEIQNRHPHNKQGLKWGQHNTVLIDDSAVKASAQPFNHLALPEYGKHQVVAEKKLESEGKGVLLQIINRLQELSLSNDVSYFLRSVMEADR